MVFLRLTTTTLCRFTVFSISILFVESFRSYGFFPSGGGDSYDEMLDPDGRVQITWDISNHTLDGYIATVYIENLQRYRPISAPGWSLRWGWTQGEVIQRIRGAEIVRTRSDCYDDHGFHHYCPTTTIVDLMRNASGEHRRFPNCCKGGALSSSRQDQAINSTVSFQMVIVAGRRPKREKIRYVAVRDFEFQAPGRVGYECQHYLTRSSFRSSKYRTSCRYAHELAKKNPSCCMSFSTFSNQDDMMHCPRCSCRCPEKGTCFSSIDPKAVQPPGMPYCIYHMCPVHLHWHMMPDHEDNWVASFNIYDVSDKIKFTRWNLIVQHPNINETVKTNGSNHQLLTDEHFDHLMMAWRNAENSWMPAHDFPGGMVQFEIFYPRGKEASSAPKHAWIPTRIFFNGDRCVMHSPDAISFVLHNPDDDVLDPDGKIEITWEISNYTLDGYTATVSIKNLQRYRLIPSPGWSFGWTWSRQGDQVIKSIRGAEIVNSTSDCYNDKGFYHCEKPTVVDLMPNASLKHRFPNCCKGGVLGSYDQEDPINSTVSFEMVIGVPPNHKIRDYDIAHDFKFGAPGVGYACYKYFKRPSYRSLRLITTCSHPPDEFDGGGAIHLSEEKKPRTYYTKKTPVCCMSFSAFDEDLFVPCPRCSTCGSSGNNTCHNSTDYKPLPQFGSPVWPAEQYRTYHMCPISVHWHLILDDDDDHRRVRVTIENFNDRIQINGWNLIVEHPDIDDAAKIIGSNHKLISTERDFGRLLMVWGDELDDNSVIGLRNIRFDIVYPKKNVSSASKTAAAWAPTRIFLNGDRCVMPPPDAIPSDLPKRLKNHSQNFCFVLFFVIFLGLIRTRIVAD